MQRARWTGRIRIMGGEEGRYAASFSLTRASTCKWQQSQILNATQWAGFDITHSMLQLQHYAIRFKLALEYFAFGILLVHRVRSLPSLKNEVSGLSFNFPAIQYVQVSSRAFGRNARRERQQCWEGKQCSQVPSSTTNIET